MRGGRGRKVVRDPIDGESRKWMKPCIKDFLNFANVDLGRSARHRGQSKRAGRGRISLLIVGKGSGVNGIESRFGRSVADLGGASVSTRGAHKPGLGFHSKVRRYGSPRS